jgi:uncharacterized caspase-like protein
MWGKSSLILFGIILFAIIIPEVHSANRTALVIGNADYELSRLKNPANDAIDMANVLRELNFDVIKLINADKDELITALDKFYSKLYQSKVGLFYFAGHGIQINDQNHLIPVDMKISDKTTFLSNTIEVGSILRRMKESKTNMNIIILDACRNNPFSNRINSINKQHNKRGMANERKIVVKNKGLAKMFAPEGTFIAFATSPGSVAIDGTGDNGIYTKYLKEYIKVPNWTMERAFKEVRKHVVSFTNGDQVPWDRSSLMGDFYFVQPKVIGTVTNINTKWAYIEASIESTYNLKPGDTIYVQLNSGKSLQTKVSKMIGANISVFVDDKVTDISKNNNIYNLNPNMSEDY